MSDTIKLVKKTKKNYKPIQCSNCYRVNKWDTLFCPGCCQKVERKSRLKKAK